MKPVNERIEGVTRQTKAMLYSFYQQGYKDGQDIEQLNAIATKEEVARIEYQRGFTDAQKWTDYLDADEGALKHAEALKAYCQSRKGDHCSNCIFGNRVRQGSGYFWRCRLYDMPGFWKLSEELLQVCEDSQQTE